MNGQLQEFRLIHPDPRYDHTFAIELQGQLFFPIQDARANICALQKQDGSLAEWIRYSAFGEKVIFGDLQGIYNPWRFANKREVINLTLFAHRFYNSQLMRWQTTDPLGFEDGLNLYTYVHNNPFCYKDPDGKFAFVIPLVIGAFGTGGIVLSGTTVGALAGTTIGLALGWGVYEACKWVDITYNQIETDQEKEKTKVKNQEKFKFPENPDDLLPDLRRDKDGYIYPADNIRIRPEKHEREPGDTYNPRHHGQHYHVETRRDPFKSSWKNKNKEIIKPPGYYDGMGTGFLPGEIFPGV